MSDLISPILLWLNTHPSLAGIATFIISTAESVAIIGTIVPGSVMMTAIGTLAGAGIIPLWSTIVWAILGAIVGDGISYWMGYYFKDRLRLIWPFTAYPNVLASGETFVHKYGSMSVFLGRFIGPVRALVPLVAGMFGMKPLSFTIANVLSAIGWAPLYMLPGILLGAASLELPPDISMHVFIVLLLIGLGCLLAIWIVIQLIHLIRKQIDQGLNKIWRALQKSHYFSSLTTLLKHHDPTEQHGQLTLAFYCLLSGLLFIWLAIHIYTQGSATIVLNNTIYYLARGLRTDYLDPIIIALSMLGETRVILPSLAIICLWLYYRRYQHTVRHLAVLSILAVGSVFSAKHLIHSPRPLGIIQNIHRYLLHDYSMPSGHTLLASIFFMSVAFLLAVNTPVILRRIIYGTAILFISAVSLSRLYLGAHWFTDIVGAWLLGTTLLTLIALSYLRNTPDKIPPYKLLCISLGALLLSGSIFYYQENTQLQKNYTLVSLPQKTASIAQWWQNSVPLFIYRTSLIGFPSLWINIQWAGELSSIRQTLLTAGWTQPPKRNWVNTLHRLTGIQSTQYIPLISPQYLDKKPSLILMRWINQPRELITLRLWEANIHLMDSDGHLLPLWVGVVNAVKNTYSWIYRNPGEINIDDATTLFNQNTLSAWQLKWMFVSVSISRKHTRQQNILFIKPNSTAATPTSLRPVSTMHKGSAHV